MILIECSPPFQWRPTYQHVGLVQRWMWGWFAVAWTPCDFNEFVEGIGEAGADIRAERLITAGKGTE